MFTKNTIRKRVMSVINNRIQSAEKQLENGCKEIDENHIKAVAELEAKREQKKENLANGLVQDILGKVLN
jgi:hypothetical protein